MTHLTDTHAHLFWDSFKDDFDEVLKRSVDAGVNTIINVGTDIPTSRSAVEIAIKQYDKLTIYSSIAIHPEDATRYGIKKYELRIKEDMEELEKIYHANPQKVIAVGECGLDYSYFKREGFLPKGMTAEQGKELQRKLLQGHIDLAKKLSLPLLLHVRDDRSENPELIECWDEVFEMAGDHFGILHCYSGLEKTTKRAMESNYLVSFAGNLTYKKNDYLREAVKTLPLEKIVLETDCPFLAPQSIRGQRNEPSSVKEIAKLVAELKGISVGEVAKQTTKNVRKLLGLT